MDNTQKAQEEEYQFPYHYLPIADHQGFRWFRGYKCVNGTEVILKELSSVEFSRLDDAGWGDGLFIRKGRFIEQAMDEEQGFAGRRNFVASLASSAQHHIPSSDLKQRFHQSWITEELSLREASTSQVPAEVTASKSRDRT